jgi:DnaJ-like protein/exodeoxyribonuclease X-like protein
VAKRDPHGVLGVARDADATRIKAAWRKLARAHHPDLTGDDPEASRVATRKMAEINDAYAALIRDLGTGSNGSGSAADMGPAARRRGGPPAPRPTRPVTGRVDTTATYRPRNQTTPRAPGGPYPAAGERLGANPPLRAERRGHEPPRASTPTGPPERGRIRNFRRPKPPPLDRAREHVIEFGKFHGHTLGEIAAFEPSYIDWVTGTATRDPELVAAARVVQADLDARGVPRRSHPALARATRSA